MEYKEKIQKGISEISNTNEDVVIIGDNSIGKTDIILQYLNMNKDKNIYFIDSYNKKIDVNFLNIDRKEDASFFPTREEILTSRILPTNFNLKDSFGTNNIEKFYLNFKEDLNSLLLDFLDIKLEFQYENFKEFGSVTEILVNGNRYDKLSNGYQAIVRLFLELLNAKRLGVTTVLIDEVNEFLSPKNEEKILPFIKDKFKDMRFILTTHSSELIASGACGKLLILYEDFLEVQQLEYFETPADVRNIHLKMFNSKDRTESNFESILRELLMKKRLGTLSSLDKKQLKNIDVSKLNYVYFKLFEKLSKEIGD